MGEYEDQLGRIAAERQEVEMPVAVERQQKGRDLVPFAFITPNQAVDQNGDDIAVTKSGAVRTVPYDPSEVEATVNLIINPFWTGLSYWGSDIGTRTLVGRSIVVTSAGSSASLNCYTSSSTRIPFVAGTVLTSSFWLANNTGKPCNYTVRFRQFNSAGTNIGDKASLLMTLAVGERKRVTFTATADANAVTMFMVFTLVTADGTNIPSGNGFELWEPQVELGNVAHPFVDPMEKYVYWLGNVGGSSTARLPEHPDRYQEATTNIDTNPVARDVKRNVNAVAVIASSRIDNAGLDHPTAGRIDTATRVAVTANLSETTLIGKPFTVTPAVGDTFSSQVWFRVSKGLIGKTIQYRLSKNGGTSEHSFVVSEIATGEWQYFRTVLNVTTAGGTGMFDYLVFPDAIGNAAYVGEYIDFTATQLELKPYSTPLVDINSPDVTWAGTPFASASSRPTRQDPLRGAGYFIEEGTTNLLINPHFMSNASSWLSQNVTTAIRPLGRLAENGNAKNEAVVEAGVTPSIFYLQTSPSVYTVEEGESITFSSYVQGVGSSIGRTIKAMIIFRNGSTNLEGGPDTNIVLDGTEQRVVVTGTAPATATNYYCLWYLQNVSIPNSLVSGEKIIIWAPQAEKKAYATSFAVGDMGTGYSWSGSAHASSSVRIGSAVSYLTGSTIPRTRGSLYSRTILNPVLLGNRSQYPQSIGNIGNPTQHQMAIYVTTAPPHVLGGRAGTEYHAHASTPAPMGVPLTTYFEWDGNSVAFDYRDGVGKRFSIPNWDFTTVWNGPAVLGNSGIGAESGPNARHINGPAACSILFNRPLSDAEIAYLDSIPTHALTFENVRRVDFWESDDG